MHVEALRDYCLAKKGVTESEPFGPGTLVIKVLTKMFAIIPLDNAETSISLKMDKELVPEWRDKYDAIQPGWHLNKTMWNAVYTTTGAIPKQDIMWLIDHSYNEVIKKMTKKEQALLGSL